MGYSLFIKNFLEIGFENNLAKFLNGYISFVPPTVRFVLLSGGFRFVFDGFWFYTTTWEISAIWLAQSSGISA